MKTLKCCCLVCTAFMVVFLYIVAPIAMTLRPMLGGLLRPLVAAIVITLLCATGIITILRRSAPIATGPRGLLMMPVVPNPEILVRQESNWGHVVRFPYSHGSSTSLANGGSGPLAPMSMLERPARPAARPQTGRPRGRHRSQNHRYRGRARWSTL